MSGKKCGLFSREIMEKLKICNCSILSLSSFWFVSKEIHDTLTAFLHQSSFFILSFFQGEKFLLFLSKCENAKDGSLLFKYTGFGPIWFMTKTQKFLLASFVACWHRKPIPSISLL